MTGSAATKAKAAAVKAAGGGTATAVTTDFTGKGYEVTVKKSGGSTVEIHLDNSFNVVSGRARRGPRRAEHVQCRPNGYSASPGGYNA